MALPKETLQACVSSSRGLTRSDLCMGLLDCAGGLSSLGRRRCAFVSGSTRSSLLARLRWRLPLCAYSARAWWIVCEKAHTQYSLVLAALAQPNTDALFELPSSTCMKRGLPSRGLKLSGHIMRPETCWSTPDGAGMRLIQEASLAQAHRDAQSALSCTSKRPPVS